MIKIKVHFEDEELDFQVISFLILPKLGETISYAPDKEVHQFKVVRIIHNVDSNTNKSFQELDIYVARIGMEQSSSNELNRKAVCETAVNTGP